MKYVAAFFGVVFLLFAYWQINDPDPFIWIPVYLMMVYTSWQVFRDKYNLKLFIGLAVLYLAGAIYLWPSHYEGLFTEGAGLNMKTPNQELGRESLGLGICFVVLVVYVVTAYLRKKKS
jgi:hypothetical protein